MKDVLCDKSKQNNYFALQNILNFSHKIARCICHTKQELHICSLQKVLDNIYTFQSSGCGSVDRAIAYNTRVRSSNPVIDNFMLPTYCQLYWKAKNKEKDTANGPFIF